VKLDPAAVAVLAATGVAPVVSSEAPAALGRLAGASLSTGPPSSPRVGDVWSDGETAESSQKLLVWDGTAWVKFSSYWPAEAGPGAEAEA
jgi:hypothetical protein